MNKLSLGLAAVGLTASMAATAALPTGAAPFQINIPNLKSGLVFNLTGLYLRPTNEDLDYVSVIQPGSSSAGINNVFINSVKPGYDFGFHLGFGYVFPNSGNDIQIGWTHLNASDSNDTSIKPGDTFGPIESPRLIETIGSSGGTASGDVRFKYNTADLNVGQYVNIGTRLSMRMYAGVQYTSITKDFDQEFRNLNSQPDQTLHSSFSSDMDGVGPQFGLTTSYHISNCVGVVGNVSTAVLVSRVKSESFYSSPDNSTPPSIHKFTLRPDSVNRVVPTIAGKLGLDYTHAFNNTLLSVEGGYHIAHFFDALDRYAVSGITNPDNFPSSLDQIVKKTSSFGVDGPYLSLTLKVN